MASLSDDKMERGEAGLTTREKVAISQLSQQSPTNTTMSSEICNEPYDDSQNTAGSPSSIPTLLKKIWCIMASSLSKKQKSEEEEEEEKEVPPPPLIIRKFSECPKGYSNLAAFVDSDENFMLDRRFGFLQARLLLQTQDELRALEQQLDRLDRNSSIRENDTTLHSREEDLVNEGPRVQLMKDIKEKFKEYAELMTAASKLVSLAKPAKRDYNSVRSYFASGPLVEKESKYIRCKEDLITLKPGRENAWLDAFVEKVLQKLCYKPVQYISCSAETRGKSDEKTYLYSAARINMLCTIIITATILLLLIIPIYLLWQLSQGLESQKNTAITIGTLLVCTLIFSAVLSFFTRARRHEILGAASAYCAVLVVFMSNIQ